MQKYFEKIKERLEKQKENSSYITDGIANRRIYDNGIKNAIEIVNQVAEEFKDRILINGQCCWQSCACTEKCQECNRYTLRDADIDWYESIEDWDDEFGKDTNVPSNDGWIPVSSGKLPDTNEAVNITWVNRKPPSYYADIKDKPFIATGHYHNGRWYWYSCVCKDYLDEYGDSIGERMDGNIEVIAWQPLSAPYQPKGV